MAARIAAGAVMPNAMRMAAPCSKSKPSPDHAGWAMPTRTLAATADQGRVPSNLVWDYEGAQGGGGA